MSIRNNWKNTMGIYRFNCSIAEFYRISRPNA